jgi:threonine/homoserine/homoserine lactone efflux protein
MGLEVYAAFAGAVFLLGLIPGPNVALITANAITYGTRAGLLTVCATIISVVLQLALVVLGLSALLAAAGAWLGVIRWLGVAYLVFIGVQQWRAGIRAADATPKPVPVRKIMVQAAALSLINPKTLLFDAALFSQFINQAEPALPQTLRLGLIMAVVLFSVDCLWATGAGRARSVLARYGRLSNRISGGLLVGAGLGLAAVRVR